MAELAADVLDQVDHDVYWAQRPSVYVAATAEAELLADPFGEIWRPADGPRDARHAWLRDGPWAPAPMASAAPAAPEAIPDPSYAGRRERRGGSHRSSAAFHVARRDGSAEDRIQQRRGPDMPDGQGGLKAEVDCSASVFVWPLRRRPRHGKRPGRGGIPRPTRSSARRIRSAAHVTCGA